MATAHPPGISEFELFADHQDGVNIESAKTPKNVDEFWLDLYASFDGLEYSYFPPPFDLSKPKPGWVVSGSGPMTRMNMFSAPAGTTPPTPAPPFHDHDSARLAMQIEANHTRLVTIQPIPAGQQLRRPDGVLKTGRLAARIAADGFLGQIARLRDQVGMFKNPQQP